MMMAGGQCTRGATVVAILEVVGCVCIPRVMCSGAFPNIVLTHSSEMHRYHSPKCTKLRPARTSREQVSFPNFSSAGQGTRPWSLSCLKNFKVASLRASDVIDESIEARHARERVLSCDVLKTTKHTVGSPTRATGICARSIFT